MKNTGKLFRKSMFAIACMLVMTLFAQIPIQAAASVSCKDLYAAMKDQCRTGAKKVEEKSRCSLLTYSYRKAAEDFYFAADDSQVYCVCIVKADTVSHAKDIKKELSPIYRAI